MMEGKCSLTDLAKRAGITPRTVKYYIQRGLLPAPLFRGPDTGYEEDYLHRLRAIRRLQERFLPLDAIRVELQRRTPEAIRALAEGGEAFPLAPPKQTANVVEPARAAAADVPAWERWELAPGVELHVSQAAAAQSRALAERLRDIAKQARTEEGLRWR